MATQLVINPTNPREVMLAASMVRALADNPRLRLKDGGGRLVEMTLKELRETRSGAQNRLYWGQVVTPFADYLFEQGYGKEFGDLKDYAHQTLADELLRVPLAHPETGEVLGYRTRSTTELTVPEFGQYLEDCARWLAEKTDGAVVVEFPGDPMGDDGGGAAEGRRQTRHQLT